MATRLQCFSLISAIETDIRRVLSDALSMFGMPAFLPDDMREIASERQKKDIDSGAASGQSDFSLLEYLDFGHLAQLLQIHRARLTDNLQAVSEEISRDLEPLLPIRNRVCHSRPLDYDDFSRLFDFAESRVRSAPEVWPELNTTYRLIVQNPAGTLRVNIPGYWASTDTDIPNNLPEPEFEDTGFIGRRKDVENVKRLIQGAYPVISIIGEGGVGKTALALRILYDFIESQDKPQFDVIVWVSLKTTVLTASGVDELRGAITDTLGMYSAVARGLGVPKNASLSIEELTAEISTYLAEFRVLVALDNMETIAADGLIAFLRDLPSGSKVLITSRMGLGELEHSYPLAPMSERDATQFFRRAAAAQNQVDLQRAKQDVVDRWCKKLSYSPLAIKWFISSVTLGRDPGEVLTRDSKSYQDLLQFSFRNLYESLTELGRTLVHAIHAAGSPLTKTQILLLLEAFASRATNDEVEMAIRALVNASVVRRRLGSKPDQALRYELGSFAQQFLSIVERPRREFVASVQQHLRHMRNATEESERRAAHYSYDQFAIHCHSPDERLVGARLRQALDLCRVGRTGEALQLVDDAERLMPQFSETRRVRAMILRDTGDYVRAREELEACIDLDPSNRIGKYVFGLLLVNELKDFDAAKEVAQSALESDPNELPVQSLLALALQRGGRLKDAIEIYEKLLPRLEETRPRIRVAILDQAADTCRRLAERDQRERESGLFQQHIIRALEIVLVSVRGDGSADARTKARLEQILGAALRQALLYENGRLADAVAERLRSALDTLPGRLDIPISGADLLSICNSDACAALAERLPRVLSPVASEFTSDCGNVAAVPRYRGTVTWINATGTYGFLVDDQGKQWFWHRNHLRERNLTTMLKEGSELEFAAGANQNGECAVDISASANA
jgi:LuxR family glucitol operon transcriptional activator